MQRLYRIFLTGSGDRVGIDDAAPSLSLPVDGKRDHEHLGPGAVETVEVALECAVKDDVACAYAVPASIPGLVITTGEHDCGERLSMAMARKARAGVMAHPAGRGAAEAVRACAGEMVM